MKKKTKTFIVDYIKTCFIEVFVVISEMIVLKITKVV